MNCPYCNAEVKQYKAGFNRSGSQRYRCGICKRAYTPKPNPLGYSADTRILAIRMYLEGNSQRAIGRILKVSQVLPIGLASTLRVFQQRKSPKVCIPLSWMSCTLSLATKKQDLHPNYRR